MGLKKYRYIAILFLAAAIFPSTSFARTHHVHTTCRASAYGGTVTGQFWLHYYWVTNKTALVYQWDAYYKGTGSGARISSTAKATVSNFPGKSKLVRSITARNNTWRGLKINRYVKRGNRQTHTVRPWLFQGNKSTKVNCVAYSYVN